jgi:hypothetical protein
MSKVWAEQIRVTHDQDRISRNHTDRVEFDISEEQRQRSPFEVPGDSRWTFEYWRDFQFQLSVDIR